MRDNKLKKRKRLTGAICMIAIIWLIGGAHELVRRMTAGEPEGLVKIGFTGRSLRPTDREVCRMVDEVVTQVLGEDGLAAIIKTGDKVVIKVNNVAPGYGESGKKGRGIITDARIVRHVAGKVRDIIGFAEPAELIVTDALHYRHPNPSSLGDGSSFFWSRLERTGDNNVDPEDVCYDYDADGILDGGSEARLVNLDAFEKPDRFLKTINEPSLGAVDVYLPKILRTKAQAQAAGEPETYCNVFIGLPIFKSHGLAGITGAIKLHYGIRYRWTFPGETGRTTHSGLYWDNNGIHNAHYLDEYLCAQHCARTYDFMIMDCLTGNRRGPTNINDTNPDNMVDYILTHAMLSSTDPIAMDTVTALFAGYDQETVEFLERGKLDGLGTDLPEYIRIIGRDAFCRHRQSLYDKYNPDGLYPFENGWGMTRLMNDYDPPGDVTVSAPERIAGTTYSFTYSAYENNSPDLGLARIELLVDDELVAYKNSDLASTGTLQADLGSFDPDTMIYRIAAWDKAFNCALSPYKNVAGEELPDKPVISVHPASQVVPIGDSAQLKVTAASNIPLTYQWRKDGIDIPGANSSKYTITRAAMNDEGRYSCVISNATGAVESESAYLGVVKL